MYSRVEDERLAYIRRALQQLINQVEDFQHINSEHSQISSQAESYSNRGIVLLASFLSSRAWAASKVADSLALCRSKGKPSFFITITTNPNWPEIKARLASGQTASDIPVVVCHVFKARLEMATSAKTDPGSDPSALCPDASDIFSASDASCASSLALQHPATFHTS